MMSDRSVVLVGGALEDHTAWGGLVPLLAGHATVLAPDRPGRGGNDRPDTGLAGELDDLRDALARADDVVLVGHSSGALLALRAAADTDCRVVGVVAYEPPPAPPMAGVAARLRDLVDSGERQEAVLRFLVDAVGLPDAIAQPQSADPAAIAGAHTLAADAEIAAAGLPADVAAQVTVPVTLLLGSDSPPSMVASVRSIAALLPRATVRMLDGQRHDAHRTAPALVADAVLDLLRPGARSDPDTLRGLSR